MHGKVVELLGYSTFLSKRAGTDLSNLQLNFLVQVDDRAVKLNYDSHSDACWISLDDTDSTLVDAFTREIMSTARQHLEEIARAS